MRKYIDRKLYDTGTAHEVGRFEHGGPSDFGWYREALYRKRTGEYFLYGEGNGASPYAEFVPAANARTRGSKVRPLSADAARDWAEGHLDADEVEAEWGASEEPESVNVWVSGEAKRRLLDECARTGETQAQAVERLLMGL